MKKVSSIDQLRSLLKDKTEEKILAGIIANLDPESADQFCLMCVAYLRFKIRPISLNAFLYGVTVNFLNILSCERNEDEIQCSWSINPVLMTANQVHSPENYRELLFLDTKVSKKEINEYLDFLGFGEFKNESHKPSPSTIDHKQ